MTERERRTVKLIIAHCEKIQEYMSDIESLDLFMKHEAFRDGVTLQTLVVGELIKRLSQEFRQEAAEMEKTMHVEYLTNWRGLAGIRDYVAHEYDSLDFEEIYDTVINEIPQLKRTCEYMLQQEENLQ